MDYIKAKELLEHGHPEDCTDFFKENNYPLEYGYALVLSGDLENAYKVFSSIDSHRADWMLKLIPIMQKSFSLYPTYFQIRNFLEIDLSMLFKTNQIEYINNILLASEMFQSVNNESFKCIGRALLKNGFPNEAKVFFDKSMENYYRDVELHYLFVEYYLYINDIENAKKSVENCLKLNPDYYPAKRMKEILQPK